VLLSGYLEICHPGLEIKIRIVREFVQQPEVKVKCLLVFFSEEKEFTL